MTTCRSFTVSAAFHIWMRIRLTVTSPLVILNDLVAVPLPAG